jgi:hypothetical protein
MTVGAADLGWRALAMLALDRYDWGRNIVKPSRRAPRL